MVDWREIKAESRLPYKAQEGSWFGNFISRNISIRLVPIFIRMNIAPNPITVASIIVGIAACVMFAAGSPWWIFGGSLLFVLSYMLDCCDGDVARFCHMQSKAGYYLDMVGSAFVNPLMFASLGVGVYLGTNEFRPAFWGIAAALGQAWAIASAYVGESVLREFPETATAANAAEQPVSLFARFNRMINALLPYQFVVLLLSVVALVLYYRGFEMPLVGFNWFLFAGAVLLPIKALAVTVGYFRRIRAREARDASRHD